jgi:hypothetical protein
VSVKRWGVKTKTAKRREPERETGILFVLAIVRRPRGEEKEEEEEKEQEEQARATAVYLRHSVVVFGVSQMTSLIG